MSAEQEMPEVQSHQGPPASQDDAQFSGLNSAHGMGQSKSSRRRRRKRKNKGDDGPDDGQQASSGAAGQAIPSMQAGGEQSASPQPQQNFQPRNNFQGGGGQQQQNGSGSGKRWKKKLRDRDRQRTPGDNAGNNGGGGSNAGGGFAGNGGGFRSTDTHQPGNNAFKRKGGGGGGGGGGGRQQRGPRSFVGPMDHSYRVANGNFADTPPSTIETSGNGGGHYGRPARPSFVSDSQPIDYSQGKTVPIAEDAPTRILFFIEDLFFIAKIQETARKLGVKVAFMKNDKEAIATLTEAEEADRPGLIVFDLNNTNAKPLTLIPKLKAKLKKSTSIVGFLSHIQGDLKAKAMEVGCDTVMPRAAFSQNLPNLLRRYGLEEEEEPNFNQ